MDRQNIEVRSFNINQDDSSRRVSGYAVVFNSKSCVLYDEKRGLYYNEIILPTAITNDLIMRSDIVMNYAHNDNNILARSKYGEGTLHLTVDDHGLFFEFDMPQTALGEQVRESIKRGDITTCSFAFYIDKDNCETWTRDEDGNVIRTINEITHLYDCACVVHAAYEETTISTRSLDKLTTFINMNKDDIKFREDEQQEEPKMEEQEEQNNEAPAEDTEDTKDDEERAEEPEEEEEKEAQCEDEEEKEDDEEDKEEEERNNKMNKNTQNTRSRIMEKRFSLLKAIRSAAEGKKFDAAEQAVITRGMKQMADAGQEVRGKIVLPVGELREDDPVHYTVEADGEHVVVTDYLNILEPLRAKNVLVKAGATYLTGLKGNIQIPIASDVNAYWEGEITKAQNGAGSFSHITMAPRRIAVEIPISKQFIVQDTLSAENLIRNLLVTKINNKLEATILSDAAADGNVPAGIFNGLTPATISSYADVCDLEAELEDNNFDGDFKYIVNPKAKAALRCMLKGTNATGMVWENNEIDGTPADWTTHLETGLVSYGDWSQLYIGEWGGLDLTVDPYTLAGDGQIRLVVNCFFDYKVVRNGAIVVGEVVSDDND